MRDIHVAHFDKARPVLVLTRDPVRSASGAWRARPDHDHGEATVEGLSTELPVGPDNGLGRFFDRQEPTLTAAIVSAFALSTDDIR